MKKTISALLLGIMIISCAHIPCSDGADARAMMSSSVKIEVTVIGTLIKQVGENAEGEPILQVESEKIISWTGSGVVVANDLTKGGKGQSLVMSAAHVTNVPALIPGFDEEGNINSLFITDASIQSVQLLDGSYCDSEEIWADVDLDVGVIKTSCIAGTVAPLALDLPPVGAMVSVSGAGLGIHPKGVFLVTDGRYVGSDDGFDGQLIVTLPVAPGHSGSGLFYKGHIFGIVSRRTVNFEHVTLAVSLENMRKAFDGAMEIWSER